MLVAVISLSALVLAVLGPHRPRGHLVIPRCARGEHALSILGRVLFALNASSASSREAEGALRSLTKSLEPATRLPVHLSSFLLTVTRRFRRTALEDRFAAVAAHASSQQHVVTTIRRTKSVQDCTYIQPYRYL